MGTNYYIVGELGKIHIGKCTYGHAFALRIYPELSINSWSDWQPYLSIFTIQDEYGNTVTHDEFAKIVTERDGTFIPVTNELRRAKYPAKRGDGSYDYFSYEFC